MKQESSRYDDSEGVAYWIQIIQILMIGYSTYNAELTRLLADPLHSRAASSGTLHRSLISKPNKERLTKLKPR